MEDNLEKTIRLENENERLSQALKAKLEKMKILPGDVVLVTPSTDEDINWSLVTAQLLGQFLSQTVGPEGCMIVLPPGCELEAYNEDRMGEAGWYRRRPVPGGRDLDS